MTRTLCFFALALISTVADARGRYYGGDGVSGPAAWLIATPIYWFTACHYLYKAEHKAVAALVILALMAINGPFGIAMGVLGIVAAYWIYWPFTLSHKFKNHETLGGTFVLGNLAATIAVVFLSLDHLATAIPAKW